MQSQTYLGDVNSGYGPVPLFLTPEQRFEHFCALGATGVGKSTLLTAIAAQDIARGDGILYIDPHGDDAERLLDLVPPWRRNHVCYLSLADHEWSVAFNIVEYTKDPDERARIADALVSGLRDIWLESWGPRMEIILRHSALALLEVPNSSIALIPRLLTDDAWRLSVVAQLTNRLTRAFFDDRFAVWRDAFRSEAIEPVLNKLDAVLSFPSVFNIVAQHRSTLHLEHAMERGRIVICNLSKGSAGDTAAHLMGALIIARARTAAMARTQLPEDQRLPFHVIVDEMQSFATNSVPSILAEARKVRISITFATQFLAGLTERTRAAVLGTTGSIAAFRMSPEDGKAVGPKFNRLHTDFNVNSLNELDRGVAYVKLGPDDVRRVACSLPPVGFGVAETVRRQSRKHYAWPRAEVERRINSLLEIRSISRL